MKLLVCLDQMVVEKTTTIAMILGLLKPSSGKILVDGIDIENNRIELLHKMNFLSPYIELPKKLTVKENLIVYSKLYSVRNFNERINYLSETLRLNDFINKKNWRAFFRTKKIELV